MREDDCSFTGKGIMAATRSLLSKCVSLAVFSSAFAGWSLPAAGTALDDYVAEADENYTYSLNNTISGFGYTAHVLDMTSHAWRRSSAGYTPPRKRFREDMNSPE